jgi:hypothetical protein
MNISQHHLHYFLFNIFTQVCLHTGFSHSMHFYEQSYRTEFLHIVQVIKGFDDYSKHILQQLVVYKQ